MTWYRRQLSGVESCGGNLWCLRAVGIDDGSAAEAIRKMPGVNQIPILLKRVDQLTKVAGGMAAERRSESSPLERLKRGPSGNAANGLQTLACGLSARRPRKTGAAGA
jgi:hypothetical protein